MLLCSYLPLLVTQLQLRKAQSLKIIKFFLTLLTFFLLTLLSDQMSVIDPTLSKKRREEEKRNNLKIKTRRSKMAKSPSRSRLLLMQEAQHAFRSVVKNEMDTLLSSGLMTREVAVRVLLSRIVNGKIDDPSSTDIDGVMKSFHLSKDDAIRALIVKEELERLKQVRGLDPLQAMEELTWKMQGMNSHNDMEDDIEDDDEYHMEGQNPQDDDIVSSSHYTSTVFDAIPSTPPLTFRKAMRVSNTLRKSVKHKVEEKDLLMDDQEHEGSSRKKRRVDVRMKVEESSTASSRSMKRKRPGDK